MHQTFNPSRDTVGGFIFVGTNFLGLSKSHTLVGFKFVVLAFSFIIHTENHFWLVLDFVDRTLHDNHEIWYPRK